MTTLLEVFSDYVCPWCYLGSARVTRLQEDWDIDVNLADIDRLVDIAAGIGLDPDRAREVLRSRGYRTAVSADWERSCQLGVTGVPTYRAGDREAVGAQPYEVLEELVQEAGAQGR